MSDNEKEAKVGAGGGSEVGNVANVDTGVGSGGGGRGVGERVREGEGGVVVVAVAVVVGRTFNNCSRGGWG